MPVEIERRGRYHVVVWRTDDLTVSVPLDFIGNAEALAGLIERLEAKADGRRELGSEVISERETQSVH